MSTEKTQKTTNKHFETFKEAFLYWQRRLGLMEWNVYFHHDLIPDHYAELRSVGESRTATVTFSTEWLLLGYPLTDEHIWETARHEALHLMQAPMYIAAVSRFVTASEIDTIDEGQVCRIEALIDLMEEEKEIENV